MDLRRIMLEAQKVQQKMEQVEEELADLKVEGTAGGGAVKVVMSGLREVLEVKIEPSVVDPNDVESLEALIFVAIKSAQEKAEKMHEEKMAGSGVPNLPFGR